MAIIENETMTKRREEARQARVLAIRDKLKRNAERIASIRGKPATAIEVLTIKVDRRIRKANAFRKRSGKQPLIDEEIESIITEEVAAMEARIAAQAPASD